MNDDSKITVSISPKTYGYLRSFLKNGLDYNKSKLEKMENDPEVWSTLAGRKQTSLVRHRVKVLQEEFDEFTQNEMKDGLGTEEMPSEN